MTVDLGLLGFALSLGAFTFFSPCAVALLPSYLAFYAGTGPGAREASGPRQGLVFGSAAAAGILVLFALGGVLIYALRTRWPVLSSADLLAGFTWIGTAVGAGLVVLGVLMLLDRAPSVTVPVRAPQQRTMLGMAGFGAAYALASMGCTLPLFFGLLGALAASSPLESLAAVLAFGAGIAGLMLAVGFAGGLAEGTLRGRLRRWTHRVRLASGVLLVLAGLYVLEFYLDLTPLV